MACFKAYSFRMRAKSDTYNDETRVKHTVVAVDNINPEEYCRSRDCILYYHLPVCTSFADPGSGAFLTPGSGIRDG